VDVQDFRGPLADSEKVLAMSRTQLSLARMNGFVLVLGLNLAAVARPSEWSAPGALLLTVIVLLMATLVTRFGREPRHFAWGFALFGWSYLILALGPWSSRFQVSPIGGSETRPIILPTTRALAILQDRVLNLEPSKTIVLDPMRTDYQKTLWQRTYFTQAGHALIALLMGLAGGLAGSAVAVRDRGQGDRSSARARGPDFGRGLSSERWAAAVQAADKGQSADPALPTPPLLEP
jgi:hypothetical protein